MGKIESPGDGHATEVEGETGTVHGNNPTVPDAELGGTTDAVEPGDSSSGPQGE